MRESVLRFGPWRVERALGRDLCGTYYLAHREPGDQRATLYVLSGQIRMPETGRDELLRALIVRHGRSDHPGLVRFRDLGHDEDDAFLIADALDDGLEPLRAGRRPQVADVRDTGAVMADALADAHAGALFHGALDLDNVVWAPGRQPRILGTGVAALGTSDHAALVSSDVAGLGRILCALIAGWQPRPVGAGFAPGTTVDSSTRELVRLLAEPGAALSMREAHSLLRSSDPTRVSIAAAGTGSGETRPDAGRQARAAAATEAGHAGREADQRDRAGTELAEVAAVVTASDQPGGRLGRYRVLNQLGRGGMGEVFLAEDPVLHRGVAIKRIRPGLERDRTYRARLRREAQMAAKLGHRAIVQVFDLVTEAGADHVVMEYVPGPSLHALLAAGPVPAHEVVRIAKELADGLAHAHQHGIIHRDLKLENILFTGDGQPKIADFGIARRATGSSGEPPGESLTRDGFVVGTSRAMSPEQIQGHDIDARSDLFSFGVMLYELLTGLSPFAADVDAQTILRVLHHRQDPVRSLAPTVSGALSDLIDRLLEKSPAARPQSAREVLTLLARLDEPDATAADRVEPPRDLQGATWSLRAPVTPAEAIATGSDPALPQTRSERRQITLACFDLMTDPEPEDPDPEPLADALPRFRAQVDEVLAHFEGTLVSVLGHRFVVVFGHPRPLEDAARRAVMAARALVDIASRVTAGDPAHAAVRFGARAAVHTGLVIVRRSRGGSGPRPSGHAAGDELILGTALDAALRLLQLGVPGELWLSGATARLVETDFRLDTPTSLPDGVTSARRVVGAADSPGPGASERDRPLVARDQELQLLANGWRRARQGAGQVALLIGDPGIGKSRLVREVQRSVAADRPRQILVRGTAHQQRSALEPAAALVSALLGIGTAADDARANLLEGDSAGDSSDAVGAAPGSGEPVSAEAAAQLVLQLTTGRDEAFQVLRLLGLPLPAGPAPAAVTPDRARAQLLGGLRDVILRSADDGPILIVVEDLHWLDPSTLDLIALLVAELGSSPLFLLMTTRPGMIPPWPAAAAVTQLHLARLDAMAIDAVIVQIAQASAGRSLSPRECALIAARSEGVPLYAEELVRAALDVDRGSSDAVPSSLRDALAARLHQLGAVTTRVACVAAVAGRELTAELVATAGDIDRATVDRELDRLVAAEILFRRRGRQRDTLFVFRHVLLQQAAYDELVAGDRRGMHGRIADVLLASAAAADAAGGHGPAPELIAHHLAGGRRFDEAIASAGRAAGVALTRHATVEAIDLYRQSLTWLEQLPASDDRDRMEIGLRMQLGALLIATAGYTSPELEASCARAEVLCDRHPDVAMPVKYGLWAVRLMRGGVDLEPLIGWFERVIASDDGDPGPTASPTASPTRGQTDSRGDSVVEKMMAHAALGTHGYVSASYGRARHHLRQAMDRFDPTSHARVVLTYGGAGGFYGHLNTTSVLWHVGETGAAWRHNQDMIALARTLDDPYTLTAALAYDLVQGFATHDAERAERAADEVRALSERYSFPYFLCTAMVGHGWAQVQRGHHDRGLREIEAGLAGKTMMGVKVYHPYYIAHLVEAALTAGQIDLGLRAVDDALALCQTTVDRMYEPELIRLRGDLWQRQGGSTRQATDAARAAYQEALALGDGVGAWGLSLRAATSLARALRDLDRSGDAIAALDAAIVRFPDSALAASSDPDLAAARRLRVELG